MVRSDSRNFKRLWIFGRIYRGVDGLYTSDGLDVKDLQVRWAPTSGLGCRLAVDIYTCSLFLVMTQSGNFSVHSNIKRLIFFKLV